MASEVSGMDIGEIKTRALEYMTFLDRQKRALAPSDFGWYPYTTLNNFQLLDQLLTGPNRRLLDLIGSGPAVDVGAADGDTAFFMESLGCRMQIVDFPQTNYNGCRGLRALRKALRSKVEILEVNLDEQFILPSDRYDLVFFFGTLYHLKNPFYALERLAQSSRHALISTRITRFNAPTGRTVVAGDINDSRVDLSRVPIAYLLGPHESNNDPTNYWIFSDAGFRRVLDRAGWDVLDYIRAGNTAASDPATPAGDERAFCLVRSRTTA
jgi:hypothetical protein